MNIIHILDLFHNLIEERSIERISIHPLLPEMKSGSFGKKVIKVLYVQHDVLEKSSTRTLEEATSLLIPTCVFTVVTNGFIALEQLEITRFELVIVEQKLAHMTGVEMIRIMRNLSISVPVILLSDCDQYKSVATLVQSMINSIGVVGVLVMPYTSNEFCQAITLTLSRASINLDFFEKKKPGRKRKFTPVEASCLPVNNELPIPSPFPSSLTVHCPGLNDSVPNISSFSWNDEVDMSIFAQDFGDDSPTHSSCDSEKMITTDRDLDSFTTMTDHEDEWIDFMLQSV